MVQLQPATFDQLFGDPQWPTVLEEYKSHAAGYMPSVELNLEGYRELQELGRLSLFTARHHDQLVGFITILKAGSLKYNERPIAISESFFVVKAQRMTGAGLALLALAEDKAREIGAKGLLVGAPPDGPLDKMLPRYGYQLASRIYFKGLDDA
jgi:GNAT superfamily N-acetyltransferase